MRSVKERLFYMRIEKALLLIAGMFCIVSGVFAAEHEPVKRGRWKVIEYDTPDTTPIVFSGWSKAQDAHALEYCMFLDIFHTDGTATWGRKADFNLGTHDWEMSKKVVFPKKPVKRIEAFALFRSKVKGEKTRGSVQFRDFKVERREGTGETFSTFSVTDRPFSNGRAISKTEFKGRVLKETTVTELSTDKTTSPIPNGKAKVWIEDSMKLVTPLTFPDENAESKVELSLAKRERESVQVLISTAADVEWRAATLHISPLKRKDGTVLRGKVEWSRQGYLAREHGALRHPHAFPENERWFPDPLMPSAPMRVRPASTQGAWVTVFADANAEAGKYEGTIVVRDGGREMARVPVFVTVHSFALPATFGLETAFTVMDGFTKAIYPECYKERKRQAIDIMLDHRLNPDDISRTTPPEIEDLLYARSRGMNRFNILNIVPPPKNPNARWVLTCSNAALKDPKLYDYFVGVVKPYVQELKKHGLDSMAYVYGFDERPKEFNPAIEEFWRKFQRDVPGIPMMTTAKNYHDFAKGKIKGPLACDWFCPTTDSYSMEVSDALRKEGKKVWWYVCCSPTYPYANFASWEYPPIEGRLLGWMTHLYRSDGLLFWIVNKWFMKKRFDPSDTFFPDFHTRNSNGMPGDGIMMYPGEDGIWPSIKLAQCRDGVEDYEYLQLAAAKVGTEKCDEVTKTIVKTLTDYSRDPVKLRAARKRLAQIIEAP